MGAVFSRPRKNASRTDFGGAGLERIACSEGVALIQIRIVDILQNIHSIKTIQNIHMIHTLQFL